MTRRRRIKLLIVTSPTVEQADQIINTYYHFSTVQEKIAFLKGMFDVEVLSHGNPDENTYWAILNSVLT